MRRNQKFLRPFKPDSLHSQVRQNGPIRCNFNGGQTISSGFSNEFDSSPTSASTDQSVGSEETGPQATTRSGRVSKPICRYGVD